MRYRRSEFNLFRHITHTSVRTGRQLRGIQRPTVTYLCPHRTMTSESRAVLAAKAALASVDLSNYDPEQSKLMDERCILVDEQDNAIGAMDKKTC